MPQLEFIDENGKEESSIFTGAETPGAGVGFFNIRIHRWRSEQSFVRQQKLV
jgi:hypothetical protein